MSLTDNKGHPLWELAKTLDRSEPNLYTSLQILERKYGILKPGDSRLTTNPETSQPKKSEIPYYIVSDLRTFKLSVDNLIEQKDLLEEFLSSAYTNQIILGEGFHSVYTVIKTSLKNEGRFIQIIPSALLNQPATILQYRMFGYLLQLDVSMLEPQANYIDNENFNFNLDKQLKPKIIDGTKMVSLDGVMRKLHECPNPETTGYVTAHKGDIVWKLVETLSEWIDPENPELWVKLLLENNELYSNANVSGKTNISYIEMLKNFDPLEAIPFYRENIREQLMKGCKRLRERDGLTDGFFKFIFYDTYLSPLTSYPVNKIELLTYRPFERIYEDAFLLKGDSPKLLAKRAFIIYDKFADFLFEIYRGNQFNPELMKTQTQELIFHWNIASTRFDLAFLKLYRLHQKETNSGNYHLKTEDMNLQIIDLENDEPLIPPHETRTTLIYGLFPRIFRTSKSGDHLYLDHMKEPFTHLRPCKAFELYELKSDSGSIQLDRILYDLKAKLDEEDN